MALSCKGKAFCPSCGARRMSDTSAHLVDRVLPQVAYRQWVPSYPRRLRLDLARDAQATTQSVTLFVREVFRWQRQRARQAEPRRPRVAAVSFTQRLATRVLPTDKSPTQAPRLLCPRARRWRPDEDRGRSGRRLRNRARAW